MVAALHSAARVDTTLLGREKVLPTQIAGTGTHLSGKPFRKPGLAEPFGKVCSVNAPHGLQLGVQFLNPPRGLPRGIFTGRMKIDFQLAR